MLNDPLNYCFIIGAEELAGRWNDSNATNMRRAGNNEWVMGEMDDDDGGPSAVSSVL